jgi:hypothetical protein
MTHSISPHLANRIRHLVKTPPIPQDYVRLGQSVPKRQEVMFPDGTHVHLRTINGYSTDARFMRAVDVKGNAASYVVDLRRLVPDLGDDICRADSRDVPYLVFMSLRMRFTTANAFLEQVQQKATSVEAHP